MQTTDLSLSAFMPPSSGSPPREIVKQAPVSAPLPAESSPASRVSISPSDKNRERDVYNKPSSIVTYLREDNHPNNAAAAAVSKTLATHLSSLSDKREPFRPGLFFSQAGALSREANSYSNEARSMRLAMDVAPETMRPDFSTTKGIVLTAATLSIRTRDGDNINMTLTHALNGGSLLFTFNIEGELSEEEQLALEKLAIKLGEVADEFFRSGTAELRGLDDFDSKLFESFNLSFNKFNGFDYDIFSYNYSVDETNNTAQLTAEDTFGYEFDISTHTQGLLKDKQAFAHQTLEQYLALIRQAANEHKAESSSIRFMLDGLRTMLFAPKTNMTTEDTGALEQVLENFDTGLPDFEATFNSPVVHNPDLYTQVSSMHLHMGQTTDIDVINNRTLIQQKNFYELTESHWLASPGMEEAHLDIGNYRYINQHVRESITRTLDSNGSQVKDALVEHEKEWSRKEQLFVNFKAQPASTNGDSYHTLINLMDQLDQQANNNQPKLLKLLENSHKNLFTGWFA